MCVCVLVKGVEIVQTTHTHTHTPNYTLIVVKQSQAKSFNANAIFSSWLHYNGRSLDKEGAAFELEGVGGRSLSWWSHCLHWNVRDTKYCIKSTGGHYANV